MFKKIGIICLFLIFVCCLSVVSAADLNQTDDVNVEVSCVNGTTDDINVDEVDESQDLDNVSGDLDRVDESEISAIECSSATSHVSAGHKIVSNILILNHTNGTHFPVPFFPGGKKPVSAILVVNHTNGTPFPVPFFPKGKKPVSAILVVNHTNGTLFPVPFFPEGKKPVSSILIVNHTNGTPFPVPSFPVPSFPVPYFPEGKKPVSSILIVNGTNSTPFPVPYFPGGKKPVSSILIVNGTNSTPFPVPYFPGGYKPINFVSNNTNGAAVCSAGDNATKGINMSQIEILKAILSFDFKKLTGVVSPNFIIWLIALKVAKDLDARYKKKCSGKYLTYV